MSGTRQGGQHQGGGRPGGKKHKGGNKGNSNNQGGNSGGGYSGGRQSTSEGAKSQDTARVFDYKEAQKWMLDTWDEWNKKDLEVYECRGGVAQRQKPSPEVLSSLEAIARSTS